MKQIDLREGARRQHRPVALFAVIQCWLRNLDGLVLTRQDLERLLGLERFKRTRVDWLREDFRDFFPHQTVYWYSNKEHSFASLFISRVEMDKFLPSGSMSNEERLRGVTAAGGPQIALFEMWPVPEEKKVLRAFKAAIPFFADAANYDERLLAAYLTLLSQGQISPKSLPPFERKR